LRFAHDAGAFAEVGFLELLELVVVMLAYEAVMGQGCVPSLLDPWL